MNKVSIVIPVYNKEKYIEKTLLSIDRQITRGLFEIEVVLVDDCSTDNTMEVMNKFEWKEINPSNVIITQNEINSGPSITFNKAFEVSTGDFIAIMDADDIFLRLGLFTRLNYLLENKDVDWVVGNELIMDMNETLLIGREYARKRSFDKTTSNKEALELYLTKGLVLGPHVIMARRKVLESVKWLEGIRSIQDTVLMLDLLLSDFKVGFIDDYVAVYRNDIGMKTSDSLYTRATKSGQHLKDMIFAREYFKDRVGELSNPFFDRLIETDKKQNSSD